MGHTQSAAGDIMTLPLPVRRGRRSRPALPFLAALCAALATLPGSALALDAGDAAPSFSAPRLDGPGLLELAAHRGKVVYLDFWASWCAPCLVALPALDELRREFPAADFQVLAVNVDRDPTDARRFLARHAVGYPSASDPEGRIPERFGVETMPTSFLIDRAGKIHYVHRGFRRGDVDDLRRRIRGLVAGAAR
jgi:peroxiredoxin